jgi:ABC-type transport system involved in cytochrome c biogenesis permease subunit
MMMLGTICMVGTAVCWLLASVFHALSFWNLRESGHREGVRFLSAGLIGLTLFFILEAFRRHFFLPVLSHDQVLAFWAWSLAFVYLVLFSKIRSPSFGFILMPVLTAVIWLAVPTRIFCKDLQQVIRPELLHPYFAIHLSTAFLAYASFAIAFAAGFLYLLQRHALKSKRAGVFYQKLPSLEELERLMVQPFFWGSALMTAALGVGLIWAEQAFQESWIFDPKTLVTALVILAYAGSAQLRRLGVLSARKMAVFSLILFSLTVFAFISMRFIAGSHDYEKPAAAGPGSGR